MQKVSSRGKNHNATGLRASLIRWYQAKRPILLYVGKFAGLILFFTIFSLTPIYQSFLEWEVLWSANLAHGIMSFVGGGTSIVSGANLFRGSEVILEVKTRCSGLYFCWLFCAAVLAFPVGWGARAMGAALGSTILLALNILRIISLFLIGSYYPGLFAPIHEQFWPVFSLLVTVVLMGIWLLCIRGFTVEAGK
jgi:exosortase/archaeosortase family protein